MSAYNAAYTRLLRWAVLRKVARGMRLCDVAEVYGIPPWTTSAWRKRGMDA